MYLPREGTEPLARLEAALDAAVAAEPIEARVNAARKAGKISGTDDDALARAAIAAGVITEAEGEWLRISALLRDEAIRVDDFPGDSTALRAASPAAPSTAYGAGLAAASVGGLRYF
jgi:acyl-CoA dehydrogenase